MSPRPWANFVLFCSAYSPLALVFWIKDFNWKTAAINNYNTWEFDHPFLVGIYLVAGWISVRLTKRSIELFQGQLPIKVLKVNSRSNDLMNYSLPYLAALLGLHFDDGGELGALIIFMAVLYILTIKTQSVFINPILALDGYGLYDVEYTEGDDKTIRENIVLTKFDLSQVSKPHITRLSRFLFVVTAPPST
jgi:hypothetical protein